MPQLPGSDRLCGSRSLIESFALLLWLMVGCQTLLGLAVAAGRVVTMALPV